MRTVQLSLPCCAVSNDGNIFRALKNPNIKLAEVSENVSFVFCFCVFLCFFFWHFLVHFHFLVHRLSSASSPWHLYLEKREGVLGHLYLLDNICIYHNINYKAAYLGQAVPRSKVLFMFWLTVLNCVTGDLPDRWPCFQLNPCILRFCGGCQMDG